MSSSSVEYETQTGREPSECGRSFRKTSVFIRGFFFFVGTRTDRRTGLNLSRVSSPEIHGRSRACAVVSLGVRVCVCVRA